MEPKDAPHVAVDAVREVGAFIRQQRTQAELSMRKLASMAGVSNPYLSQIERGLRKPSADILQRVAAALRISVETLYVKAGLLDERRDGVTAAILAAEDLTDEQKQVLLEVYASFRLAGEQPESDTA